MRRHREVVLQYRDEVDERVHHRRAERTTVARDRGQLVGVRVDQAEARATACQHQRARPCHPVAGASHERHPSLELALHRASPESDRRTVRRPIARARAGSGRHALT